jgi:hypothetical protein
MASSKTIFRLRKTTDIHKEYATFELLADEVPILDLGFSDEGTFEVLFNRTVGRIAWDKLQDLIEQGRRMAEDDRA